CSKCGCLPHSRPTGIAGLGIREWTCDDCGTAHDRDVNAAKNILRCGLTALAEGALTSRLGSPALRPRSSHNADYTVRLDVGRSFANSRVALGVRACLCAVTVNAASTMQMLGPATSDPKCSRKWYRYSDV